ncbi:HNH endonuclease [Komagataeibacter xylinus E25]|nr:HNH endonuclease [Komagataeibacter xylinus E25]
MIHVFNKLGGKGRYDEIYPLARARRTSRGASWTTHAEASIRRTVEDHAESSLNFQRQDPSKRKAVFYSVQGHGKGVWALLPEYLSPMQVKPETGELMYHEGLEGIMEEKIYLRRTRDLRLVQKRKKKDDFTCQACAYREKVDGDKYIIDVHHIMPLGGLTEATITNLDDLVCLCPNCHRIAHSRKDRPYSVSEIKNIIMK